MDADATARQGDGPEAGKVGQTEPASSENTISITTQISEAEKSEPTEDVSSRGPISLGEGENKRKAQDSDTQMLKTTAKLHPSDRRKNNKFDPSAREVADAPATIRKQVEFYFGDWNFPQDKFMWESCEGTANKPIPVSTIHSFKRMRVFQPYSAIVEALRGSEFLEVSGSEGQEVVKRKAPYKPAGDGRAKVEAATVYVKGFGDENPDTQFDLESFFASYGEIKGLNLRRTIEGLFKGSVFVTFPDEDAAKAFIALHPAPKYKGHDLKIMSKRAYCQEKTELIRQGKLEPNHTVQKKFFEGRDPTFRKGNKFKDNGNPHDADDWKKGREHDQKKGFRDRRGGGRGRGGRGRGRGRSNFRGGRQGAVQDQNGRSGDKESNGDSHEAEPRIQATNEATQAEVETSTKNGKRAREDDGTVQDAPAAKKVNTKEVVDADAS